jgi:hypothetical protein
MKELRFVIEVKIPSGMMNVHQVEEELVRQRTEQFRKLMGEALAMLIQEQAREWEKCQACGAPLVRNGAGKKAFRTLLGAIEVERGRYRCPACGVESYPSDRRLGLDGMAETLGVRELGLWTATELSYAKSSEFLAKYTGLLISAKKLHGLALAEGGRVTFFQDQERERVFRRIRAPVTATPAAGPKVLYIQVDGTVVNERKTSGWMEAKVGTSYSQRVRVSRNRVRLADKQTYASIENVKSFGEKFYLECLARGLDRAETVYFVADGATWIKQLKDLHFPQAIGVLDQWHIGRELRKVFGESGEAAAATLKAVARAGNGPELLRRLRWYRARTREAKKIEEFTGLIGYIENNLEWIANIPKIGGYGSGPVEKTVDITIARRFKRRGMSWFKGGANPLIQLRLLRLNGTWDKYWQERRTENLRNAA